LKAPIDQLEFFEVILRALRTPDGKLESAKRLLARYGADGMPREGPADALAAWLGENRDYLFFSDQGDYRWYIDPLAKKRGVPSRDLRGPARATAPNN
jgi:hypothetical protein